MVLFFFSSRRRHTRFDCDWSSDVCSSDLIIPNKLIAYYLSILNEFYEKTGIDMNQTRFRKLSDQEKAFYATIAFDFERSEERRVGKECRSRWWMDNYIRKYEYRYIGV